MLSFVKLCNQNKKFSRLTGRNCKESTTIVGKISEKQNSFWTKIKAKNARRRSIDVVDVLSILRKFSIFRPIV